MPKNCEGRFTTCWNVSATLRCSQCKQVNYCSQKCQIADWPKHKLICKLRRFQCPKQISISPVKQQVPYTQLMHYLNHIKDICKLVSDFTEYYTHPSSERTLFYNTFIRCDTNAVVEYRINVNPELSVFSVSARTRDASYVVKECSKISYLRYWCISDRVRTDPCSFHAQREEMCSRHNVYLMEQYPDRQFILLCGDLIRLITLPDPKWEVHSFVLDINNRPCIELLNGLRFIYRSHKDDLLPIAYPKEEYCVVLHSL